VLAQVFQAMGGGLQNHNSDFATRQVLLVLEVCIHRDQDIKSSFRKAQKLAVFFSRPARFPNRPAFATLINEMLLERSRRALVNQDSLFSCAIRLSRASSMAATAISRLTPGYSSRNRSSVKELLRKVR
jgi:hypothetical protein